MDVDDMITAQRLRDLFNYDPETGIFISLKRRGYVLPGTISGYANEAVPGHSRLKICIDNKEYFVHRLAWLYVHGKWPKNAIDHIDGNPLNNRLSNLRESTQQQNVYNSKKPKTNKSGFKGVSWHAGAKKWQSHIKSSGMNRYLGLFYTAEEAHEAYKNAAIKHNGEFARFA